MLVVFVGRNFGRQYDWMRSGVWSSHRCEWFPRRRETQAGLIPCFHVMLLTGPPCCSWQTYKSMLRHSRLQKCDKNQTGTDRLLLTTEEQGQGQEHRYMGTNRLIYKTHAFIGFWGENWGVWTVAASVWLSSWHSVLLLRFSNVILGFPLLPSHVSHPCCVCCAQRPHFMLNTGSISAVLWHQHRPSLWPRHPYLSCSHPNMHCLWPPQSPLHHKDSTELRAHATNRLKMYREHTHANFCSPWKMLNLLGVRHLNPESVHAGRLTGSADALTSSLCYSSARQKLCWLGRIKMLALRYGKF